MPGVILTTSVVTGPSTLTISPTSTLFVAGVTTRGPEGSAFLVQSLDQFEDIYGGYTSSGYVHQTLQTFFEEGGSRAYVSRAVGTGAAAATASLNNAAATPAVVLTLTASGEGTWANSQLEAEVTQPTAGETFRVRILLDDVVVYSTPVLTNKEDAVEEINNSAVASLYVTATAGAGAGIPAVAAGVSFSGGAAGSAPTSAQYVTALNAFTNTLGSGAVCLPGLYGSTIWEGLTDHAVETHRIALLGFDRENTVAESVADAADHSEYEGAEHAAWYYPWVKITRNGLVLSVPCEGFVAAKRAKLHNELGPWTAYAGSLTNSSFALGTYHTVTGAESNTLNDGFVNPIRVIGDDVRIYGARSASADTENFRFITAREILNYITSQAEERLERLVFSVIDGRGSLFAEVESVLYGILDPLATAGALFPKFLASGKQLDPGYKVTVNAQLNPVTQLATGTVKARVGVRISSIGETIEVEISKSNITSSLA